MSLWRDFNKGIIDENPLLRLVLGLCPALAVTNEAMNGLAMGLAATAVLLGSNVVISCLRNLIPARVRIPVFIVVIASFVTIIDMTMHAFFLELHRVLGLFVPLIVVNCIILGRAEAFASKRPIFRSFIDGLGMGIGFTLALIILGAVREIFGYGTIFGIGLFGAGFEPALIMILPPGAFLALGLLLALMNKLTKTEEG
ncbi:MAG: electron transport complex subunit E [Gemmatimonadota bacterium]|nr:MAG: electron transport complex subunit E [Gemmatimonadota bacterium]